MSKPSPLTVDWVETVRMAAQEAELYQSLGNPWTVEKMAARLLDAAREVVAGELEAKARDEDYPGQSAMLTHAADFLRTPSERPPTSEK